MIWSAYATKLNDSVNPLCLLIISISVLCHSAVAIADDSRELASALIDNTRSTFVELSRFQARVRTITDKWPNGREEGQPHNSTETQGELTIDGKKWRWDHEFTTLVNGELTPAGMTPIRETLISTPEQSVYWQRSSEQGGKLGTGT